MIWRTTSPKQFCWLLLAVGICLLSSCGKKRVPVYPVRGSVLVEGKPAQGALVVFHWQDPPSSLTERLVPSGYVGSDGSFQLSTYTKNDGAPAGQYVVTITWYDRPIKGLDLNQLSKEPPKEPDPSQNPDPKIYQQRARERLSGKVAQDRLHGLYSNAKTSPLRAQVKEGGNDLEVFQLKTNK